MIKVQHFPRVKSSVSLWQASLYMSLRTDGLPMHYGRDKVNNWFLTQTRLRSDSLSALCISFLLILSVRIFFCILIGILSFFVNKQSSSFRLMVGHSDKYFISSINSFLFLVYPLLSTHRYVVVTSWCKLSDAMPVSDFNAGLLSFSLLLCYLIYTILSIMWHDIK